MSALPADTAGGRACGHSNPLDGRDKFLSCRTGGRLSPFIRNVIAAVVALILAFGIVMLMENFASRIHPLAAGIDATDPEQLKRALEAGQVPFSKLFLVMAGWLLAAYTGGTAAWRLSRQTGPVLVFTLIFTAAIFMTLSAMPHPTWMWLGGLLAAPLMALGGGNRSLSVPRPGI
jgi:hypothetical protein